MGIQGIVGLGEEMFEKHFLCSHLNDGGKGEMRRQQKREDGAQKVSKPGLEDIVYSAPRRGQSMRVGLSLAGSDR